MNKNFDKIELGKKYLSGYGFTYIAESYIKEENRFKMVREGGYWVKVNPDGTDIGPNHKSKWDMVTCLSIDIEVGKVYKTKDGEKVDIAFKIGNTGNYAGVIDNYVYTFDSHGKSLNSNHIIVGDYKEKHTLKGWVNVYDNDFAPGIVHPSKESADREASSRRIACVPFEIEYEA